MISKFKQFIINKLSSEIKIIRDELRALEKSFIEQTYVNSNNYIEILSWIEYQKEQDEDQCKHLKEYQDKFLKLLFKIIRENNI
jgi:hypothetical protein